MTKETVGHCHLINSTAVNGLFQIVVEGSNMGSASDIFRIDLVGSTVVISPIGDINTLTGDVIEGASEMMTEVIESQESPMLVIDLTGVPSCGSVFMSFLLRCHKSIKGRGGEMVLCGLSKMMRELLSLTRLDTVWAIYETRSEAMVAVDA